MSGPTVVEQSRAIPVEVDEAFAFTLPAPLTTLFNRRYLLLPPIAEVRDQSGPWDAVGRTRVVATADGGTMREQLVAVDPPHSFGYLLGELTGPMRRLVDHIEGSWEFSSIGTGTLVTWRWTLYPTRAGAVVLPVIARMWLGYARMALERLSDLLLGADSPG